MKLIDILDRLDEIDKKQSDTNSLIESLKRDYFGMAEGDCLGIRQFAEHAVKMNKILKEFEGGK